jgi:Skp family chaperone for outer membrane proteins
MNNRYMISAFALALTAISLNPALAQDSTKRASKPPVAAKTVVKPGVYKPAAAGYGAKLTPRNPYTIKQPVGPVVNTDKSLHGQYQYLSTKIFNYQRPQLAAFYKNVTDSLRAERKKSKELQQSLSAQGKAVRDLQTDVSTKEQSLNESNAKADAISLLGIPVGKSMYNTIMWGLVILFGAVTTFVVLQSGSARREAKYRTKLYEELDEEYKGFKVKANEKEKKLARELQTERNKLEELLGRS